MSDMKKILLTGGAGYIGSHIARDLMDNNHDIVIIDNLSTGCDYLIPPGAPFYHGDCADHTLLEKVFKDHTIDSVIHCAALIDAAESLDTPLEYYRENAVKTIELIAFCAKQDVSRFLFSSTAAVYGNPVEALVDEEAYCDPLTPYGSSKWMAESFIRDFASCTSISWGILRYFNVTGADPQTRCGQPSNHSTSVVANLCRVILGQQPRFIIHGNDYDTPDGTCIRDFIHVSDLAQAHRLALEYLGQKKKLLLLNCGYGYGFSILQLLKAAEAVNGKPVSFAFGPRRRGDIEQIVASTAKIRKTLSWVPQYDNLNTMVATALEWERKKLSWATRPRLVL